MRTIVQSIIWIGVAAVTVGILSLKSVPLPASLELTREYVALGALLVFVLLVTQCALWGVVISNERHKAYVIGCNTTSGLTKLPVDKVGQIIQSVDLHGTRAERAQKNYRG